MRFPSVALSRIATDDAGIVAPSLEPYLDGLAPYAPLFEDGHPPTVFQERLQVYSSNVLWSETTLLQVRDRGRDKLDLSQLEH